MRFVFRLASCWVNDWDTGLSDIDCLLFRWLVYHHASHHTTVWSQSHSILTLKEQHAEYTTEHVELAFNDRPDDRRCMHHDNSVSVLLAIHLCFRLLLQFRTYRDSGGFFVTTVSVFRSGEKCHQHASSLSSIHWPAPKSHHRILRFCYHSNKTRCWNLGVGQFVWTGVSFHARVVIVKEMTTNIYRWKCLNWRFHMCQISSARCCFETSLSYWQTLPRWIYLLENSPDSWGRYGGSCFELTLTHFDKWPWCRPQTCLTSIETSLENIETSKIWHPPSRGQ